MSDRCFTADAERGGDSVQEGPAFLPSASAMKIFMRQGSGVAVWN
jgi:hypothetical protein